RESGEPCPRAPRHSVGGPLPRAPLAHAARGAPRAGLRAAKLAEARAGSTGLGLEILGGVARRRMANTSTPSARPAARAETSDVAGARGLATAWTARCRRGTPPPAAASEMTTGGRQMGLLVRDASEQDIDQLAGRCASLEHLQDRLARAASGTETLLFELCVVQMRPELVEEFVGHVNRGPRHRHGIVQNTLLQREK